MITRINKNVICIKDIPSNLIEEAIFILKDKDDNHNNLIVKHKTKDIIIDEAQEIIKDCSNKLERDDENNKREIQKQIDKLRRIKINAVAISIITVIICVGIYIFKF